MRIGLLRRKLQLQYQKADVNEYGQPLPADWETKASVWGDVRHLSGSETVRNGLDVSRVSASIRIRYRTDVTPGMRVKHGDVVYDIRAVLPDVGKRRYLDLVCELGVNRG